MDLAVLIALAEHLRDRILFPGEALDEMDEDVEGVDDDGPLHPCDDTLAEAQAWLREHGHDVSAWSNWLRDGGARCDCEVVLNFQQLIESIPFGQAG